MADTSHNTVTGELSAARQIRVFLSSTFRDFMEERDLLVKQVFPSLRRRAQERGVDVVDVDLRWGVTQEESEQGKVIGICLAEIERCRPYFIGMLGERYGWTPGKTDYPDELIEREQLGWIRDHQGNASVTELEILHGVLNDKEMAGRAFFYFRDPAWSRGQSEPGFVCDTPEEEAKLAALKDRIRASGFPVAEDLPDPKAIADQIEADLWALIEEQYPDLDQAGALEKEARKHASYRQSRLGVYLGQDYVEQLEALIHGGEQKVLITGESGSGKSALIANWMHQHKRENPGDVVYAHHLGCSNDANAIRPLLGRMLDTASKLLNEAELITEPLQVPQDWWELTAKLTETLQDLGRWCRKTSHRWIWVLDGLDRLADADQQALPWLPLLIPEGVSVVISALECPAKAIIQERQFQLLEIGPLRRNEQEQLIDSYLERYTKKLDADRVEQILASPLARSPLFLRVLLEELRQCGRFETLQAQIADYIRPNADGSLAVNDLYARVLARLESDCGAEPVRKALTALWASRAGLSESDLLAITGLVPLQWAPIDLALVQAFGRNGNRLVFDHDFLRKSVTDRYLYTEELRKDAHGDLAEWFAEKIGWDDRKAEELPWQLLSSHRHHQIQDLFLSAQSLYGMCSYVEDNELLHYWNSCKHLGVSELDVMITDCVMHEVQNWSDSSKKLISFVDAIGHFLYEAGYTRDLLLHLREISLQLETEQQPGDPKRILISKANLGNLYGSLGMWDNSIALLAECSKESIRLFGKNSIQSIQCLRSLFSAFRGKEDLENAEDICEELLLVARELYPEAHPEVFDCKSCLAGLKFSKGDFDGTSSIYVEMLDNAIFFYGNGSREVLDIRNNLVSALWAMEEYVESKNIIDDQVRALRAARDTSDRYGYSLNLMAAIYNGIKDYDVAEATWLEALELYERTQQTNSPDKIAILGNLATLYHETQQYAKALSTRRKELQMAQRLLGKTHPDSLNASINFAHLLLESGEPGRSVRMLQSSRKTFEFYACTQNTLYRRCLRLIGLGSRDTGDYELAEDSFRAALSIAICTQPYDHAEISALMAGLAKTLSLAGRTLESLEWREKCLGWREENLGNDHPSTNRARYDLALILYEIESTERSLFQLDKIESSMKLRDNLNSDDQKLIDDVAGLRSLMQ